MSGPVRLDAGGCDIDRSKPLHFTFDGMTMSGFAGDTVASALLANGVSIVGRSFKYHRPRGIVSAGVEEPNAILDMKHGACHDPLCRATIEPLANGMAIRSVHAQGSAAKDDLAYIDRLARFIPSGFYYKTFLWPSWEAYEARIRAMAGIGTLDARSRSAVVGEHFRTVDVAIVGGGPAGIAAALAATVAGKSVVLADMGSRIGGSLHVREDEVAGQPGAEWAAQAAARLQSAGALMLTRTMAFGLYDHKDRKSVV